MRNGFATFGELATSSLAGLVTLWNMGGVEMPFAHSGGETRRTPPRFESLGLKEPVGASRDEMTRDGEGVVGHSMQGQEPHSDDVGRQCLSGPEGLAQGAPGLDA
jgi:hypothetical protein